MTFTASDGTVGHASSSPPAQDNVEPQGYGGAEAQITLWPVRAGFSLKRMMHRSSALVAFALAVALLVGPAASRRVDAAPAAPPFGPTIEAPATYDGQTTCDPTAKPGTIALRDLLEATYPSTSSLGIGRECSVGGVSEHKEGRAYDWALDATSASDAAIAKDFLDWLLAPDAYGNQFAMARRMGIMYLIWNRYIWKAYAPEKGWQPYVGSSPHTDHVHFSLSRAGGNGLTSWYGPTRPGWASGAVANPVLVQSRFGQQGNFELVYPYVGGGLVVMWRNNDAAGTPWSPPALFGQSLGRVDAISMIQSSYGNLEVVARAGDTLSTFWRHSTTMVWYGPYRMP